MFLKKISTAILLFGSLSLNGQVIATELKQLPVHIGGRVVVHTNEVNENYYEYSWPGVYFETAFTGDSVTLRFNDDQNIFQLIVDGKEPVIINKPGKLDYPVTGLTSGKHKIRLEKITETQSSTGQFLGFYSDDKPAKLPKRNRQIEFIGDSYTVGYGNISTTRECSVDDVYKTTNTQLAFGPLVAKHFNADYQINAYSGFGVVRNYNGNAPDKNLIAIYPFTLHTPSYIYSGKWQPEIIVIGLGTNDFSTKLKEQEPWKSRTELQQDYVEKYVAFTKHLHDKNPDAQFILMASDKMQGELAAQVQIVLEKLKASGLKKVDSIIFRGLDYKGCHWHPSAKDDRVLADMLIKFIEGKIW